MQYPPRLGFGTWQAPPEAVQAAVETALMVGYRHIDCAYVYQNEEAIGRAFGKIFKDASSGIKREDVWITSKLWNYNHNPERVREQCKKTMSDLQVDYLDLFLIHWPLAFVHNEDGNLFPKDANGRAILEKVPLADTWKAMEQLVEEGLVKHIGVSNYTVPLLADLLNYAKIKPLVNQIEVHPWNPNDATVKFCLDNGIGVTAYSPMGGSYADPSDPSGVQKNVILECKTLKAMAEAKGTSPHCVALAWHLKKWNSPMYSIIPKSQTPARVEANFKCTDLQLSNDDMDAINKIYLEKRIRFCDPACFWKIPLFD